MNQSDKLCVKELANALQVSTKFVYQMRACGFEMAGREHQNNQTASTAAAAAWIQRHDFRIVRGKGVVGGVQQ